jgi:hypothetical protein
VQQGEEARRREGEGEGVEDFVRHLSIGQAGSRNGRRKVGFFWVKGGWRWVPEPSRRGIELARKSFGRSAAQVIRKGLTESDGMKPKALGVEMHMPADQENDEQRKTKRSRRRRSGEGKVETRRETRYRHEKRKRVGVQGEKVVKSRWS